MSAVEVNFEIGHLASLQSKKAPEGFSHDWEVFVRGQEGADISHFVDKVVFHLHDTFPRPKREKLLDVFRKGFVRLLERGTPSRGRMFPIWAIVLPTAALGVTKYVAHITLRYITVKILRFQQKHRHVLSDSYNVNYARSSQDPLIEDINLKAGIFSFITMEILFYPVETIIHRLHIQGTRTIIDNLNTGTSVTPILTDYEGFMDCYNTTIAKEGVAGLYKGFGALVLQIMAHQAIVKLTTLVVSVMSNLLKPAKSRTNSEESLHSQQKYLYN